MDGAGSVQRLGLTSSCRRKLLSCIHDWMVTRVECDGSKIVVTGMRGTERAGCANLILVPTLIPTVHARDRQRLDFLDTRERQTPFGLWDPEVSPLSVSLHHMNP